MSLFPSRAPRVKLIILWGMEAQQKAAIATLRRHGIKPLPSDLPWDRPRLLQRQFQRYQRTYFVRGRALPAMPDKAYCRHVVMMADVTNIENDNYIPTQPSPFCSSSFFSGVTAKDALLMRWYDVHRDILETLVEKQAEALWVNAGESRWLSAALDTSLSTSPRELRLPGKPSTPLLHAHIITLAIQLQRCLRQPATVSCHCDALRQVKRRTRNAIMQHIQRNRQCSPSLSEEKAQPTPATTRHAPTPAPSFVDDVTERVRHVMVSTCA